MKTIFKKQTPEQDSDLSKIVDTQLTKYIDDRCNEYQQKHKQTAQKLATLNYKTMPKGTSIKEFLGPPRADHQHLIDHIEKTCNGGLQKAKGKSHISKASEDEIALDRKIEAVEVKLTPKKGKFNEDAKKFKPEIRMWFFFFIPALVLISGVELIASYDVFSSLGGNLLSSIGTAVIAMIITFGYAHFIPGKIRELAPKSAKKRLALFVLSILPIGLLYHTFSTIRIDYLLNMNPELDGIISNSPWVFTIINCLAYVICCWIIWAYKPGKEKILAYKKYRNDKKEIEQLENQREELYAEKTNLPANLRGKLTKHYNILLLGKQHEEEVVTRYQRCFEEIKMELYMQTNGACAPLFTGDINEDLPPLKLNFTKEEIHKPLNSTMSQFMGIVLLLLTLVACSTKNPPSLALTVMADYTDEHIQSPDLDMIQPLFAPVAKQNGACAFRFSSITHSSLNPSFEAILKPKDRFGNSLEYVTKKREFFKQIGSFMSLKSDTLRSYPNSNILSPVLRELILLKDKPQDKKIMLLFSDLHEASHLINIYRGKDRHELMTKPDRIVKKLSNQLNIPDDLKGVQLYIVYYPKDIHEDYAFKQMVHVWTQLFDKSQLEIHLGMAKPIQATQTLTIKSKSI
jgi:hypothetical protein